MDYTKKRTQLSLFESAVDNICDMITIKQMLKGYGDESFGGGTGPSIQCLDKRKRARNDSILTKIIQASSSKFQLWECREWMLYYSKCNKRVKRSRDFLVALKNAKSSTMNLFDLGQVNDTLRWFEFSSSSSGGRTYSVQIKETIYCTCEFFNQKNTSFKHILYVYLNVLNVFEFSHLLQQV